MAVHRADVPRPAPGKILRDPDPEAAEPRAVQRARAGLEAIGGLPVLPEDRRAPDMGRP